MTPRSKAGCRTGNSLTIAVGNTTTSLVVWSPAGGLCARRIHATESLRNRALSGIRRLLLQGRPAAIVLSGVVPDVVDRLGHSVFARNPADKCATGNPQPSIVLRFRRNLRCPLIIRPRPVADVGDDRLAAALGALAIDATVPWVVVDAGTALTVNGVRPWSRRQKTASAARRVLGMFEGGLIVPGEGLCLQALGGGTAQLPALRPLASAGKAPAWGRSTKEAIRVGVRRAQMATVVELTRAQAKVLGAKTRVVLTGGGVEALWPVFRRAFASHRPVRDPDLVHRGLLAALDLARQ